MEKETYKVQVVINQYVSAELLIPTKLDVSELYGLLDMAKKLAAISPLEKNSVKAERKERVGLTMKRWTDADKNKLIKMWDNKLSAATNAEIIAEKLGRTHKQVSGQYYYLKGRGELK